MRNIIILFLLSSTVFASSVQTKELTIQIQPSDWSIDGLYHRYIVDINQYFEMLDGNYSVQLSKINHSGSVYGNLNVEAFNESGPGNVNYCSNDIILSTDFNDYLPNSGYFWLNTTNCSFIEIFYSDFTTIDLEVTLWITGLFETNSQLQGDMNNDDMLNVIDIVEIVNIIIGDLF